MVEPDIRKVIAMRVFAENERASVVIRRALRKEFAAKLAAVKAYNVALKPQEAEAAKAAVGEPGGAAGESGGDESAPGGEGNAARLATPIGAASSSRTLISLCG